MTDLATLAIRVDASQGTAQVLTFGRAAEASAASTGILESGLDRLESAMARLRVLFGLGLFGFKFLDETIAAQNSFAQLEAGVRSTGMAAGFTAQQLADQASALQEVTSVADEVVQKGQGVLLLFNHISGTTFERATKSMLDLSERMGTDVPSAARILGRALEEPEEGLTALRRAGVVFTEAQRQQIIEMARAGEEAKAQNTILDELESRLKGSAEAARNTLGGALKGLAHDFGDLFESTRAESNGLIQAINALDDGVKFLKDHMGELRVVLEAVAGTVIARNVVAFGAYLKTIQQEIVGTSLAAEAEVQHRAALTASAASAVKAAQFEVQLAEAVLFNAKCNEQCAFAVEERVTAEAQLVAAETRALAATEASTAATIALTEAQLSEAAASANAARVATVTGAVMTRVAGLARAAWVAIGGPIGAIILGLIAVKYAWDKWADSVQKSAKLTDEQQAAYEKALATERERNTQIRQNAERQLEAAEAARKANAERDAETAKLRSLNEHYRDNTLSLKILEIQLSANTEKVKAHKDAKEAEWAAIDRSINAQAKEQIIAAKLADTLERENHLRSQQRDDTAAVRAAQQELEIFQLSEEVQSRRRIQFEFENKLWAARLDFAEKTLNATDDQVATAQKEYDSAVSRAKVERDIAAKLNEQRIAREKMADLIARSKEIGDQKNEEFDRQLKALEAARAVQEDLRKEATDFIGSFFGGMANGARSFWESFRLSAEQAFAKLIAQKLIAKILDLGAAKDLLDTLAKRRQAEASGVYSPEMINKMYPTSRLATATSAGVAGVGAALASYGVGASSGSRASAALGGALAGAASGALIGSSIVPGLGTAIGAGIGATTGLIAGLIGFNQTAQATKGELAAMRSALEANIVQIRATVHGQDQFVATLAQSKAQFDQLRDQAEKALGGKANETERERVLREINALEAERVRQLQEENAKLHQQFAAELGVRNLRAAALDDQAAALAQQIQDQKELDEAIKQFGKDSAEVQSLTATQAAEAERRALDKAEKDRRALEDLSIRGLAAGGASDRQVDDARFVAQQERELWDLRRQGASPEIIARLEEIQALERAAREQEFQRVNEQARQDFEVRRLAAEGHQQEAEDLRFLLDQQREYQDAVKAGLDEATLAALALTQAAESAARAAQKAKDEQRAIEDLSVRRLTASGQAGAADDLRFQLEQQRELEDARATHSQEFIDKLIEVQKLEAAARQAAAQQAASGADAQNKALRDVKNVVTRDAQALSETTGDRMADYLNSINVHSNEQVFWLRSIDQRLSGGSVGAASNGTMSVSITIHELNVESGATLDKDALGDELTRIVDVKLGALLKRNKLIVSPQRN